MKKTYKRIPFDIELAKKIQSGEIEGRIVNRDGYPARIICFDPIHPTASFIGLVLSPTEDNTCKLEKMFRYFSDGRVLGNSENFIHNLYLELLEEVPKYEFKVGDKVRIHAKVDPENTMYNGEVGVVDVLSNVPHVRVGTLPFAYLKEECELVESAKLKHKFKPFDKVLVRDPDKTELCMPTHKWIPGIFQYKSVNSNLYFVSGKSYKDCIPYEGNEHLVGTTDKPKEE